MTKDQNNNKGVKKDTDNQNEEKRIPFWNWYLLNGRGPPPTASSLRRTVQKHLHRERLNKKAAESFQKEKEGAFKRVEEQYGNRNAGVFKGLTSSQPNKKEDRRLHEKKKNKKEERREEMEQTKKKGERAETRNVEKRQEAHMHLKDGEAESEVGGRDGKVMMSGANGGGGKEGAEEAGEEECGR